MDPITATTGVAGPVLELRLVPDSTKEMAVRRLYIFNAVLRREGEWIVARCSEMPEAVSQGRDEAEALRNLKEAIACILEDEAGVEVNPDDLVIESSVRAGAQVLKRARGNHQ